MPSLLITHLDGNDMNPEEQLDKLFHNCSKVMTENMMARDAEEGIFAFMEKREPVWCGE